MKIFCLSIYNENFKFFKKLNFTPVGLLHKNFDKHWMLDNTKKNISQKNKYFGEYTFHYWIWKNYLEQIKNDKWIGFCTYRLFWIKRNCKINNLKDLMDFSIKEPDKEWENYDVILTEKLKIGKIKKMKILKNFGILNTLKNIKYLFKSKHTVYEHSAIFHGKNFIDAAIDVLDKSSQKKFREFLSSYEFSAENMFIVKNSNILNAYYESVFSWLSKLEKKINIYDLTDYKIRMLAFLAERYLPFWFNENCKVFLNPIKFIDTHKMLNQSNILKKLNS